MRTFICSSCRRIMPANPRVKNQRYCGQDACQRERKRKWQQAKMATDADYRANQRDAQKAWSERHHDYWRLRRLTQRAPPSPPATPHPARAAPVKMDALMVKIVPLSTR